MDQDTYNNLWAQIEARVASGYWSVISTTLSRLEARVAIGLSYSVGMADRLGVEVTVCGLPPRVGTRLINNFGRMASRKPAVIAAPTRVTGLIRGGVVEVLEVDAVHREEAALWAVSRNKDVRVLQILLPDQHGRFVGDAGFQGGDMAHQPVWGRRLGIH